MSTSDWKAFSLESHFMAAKKIAWDSARELSDIKLWFSFKEYLCKFTYFFFALMILHCRLFLIRVHVAKENPALVWLTLLFKRCDTPTVYLDMYRVWQTLYSKLRGYVNLPPRPEAGSRKLGIHFLPNTVLVTYDGHSLQLLRNMNSLTALISNRPCSNIPLVTCSEHSNNRYSPKYMYLPPRHIRAL